MGGMGSGNYSMRLGKKRTVEECLDIDINRWNREGLLIPESTFFRYWWCGGFRVKAVIEVTVHTSSIEICWKSSHGDPVQVPVTWTDCTYGGQRPWFSCPSCRKRVAKLYRVGQEFKCRLCHNLSYRSQRESDCERELSRARKIRKRLGGSGSLCEPFPEKPKGLHWDTYRGLLQAGLKAEYRGWTMMESLFTYWHEQFDM